MAKLMFLSVINWNDLMVIKRLCIQLKRGSFRLILTWIIILMSSMTLAQIETQEYLYIYLYVNFSSNVFLVFVNYFCQIQIVSCYDFSTSKLINILPFYFTFFMNVSNYGHLMFFLIAFMQHCYYFNKMLNICKAHFEYLIFRYLTFYMLVFVYQETLQLAYWHIGITYTLDNGYWCGLCHWSKCEHVLNDKAQL